MGEQVSKGEQQTSSQAEQISLISQSATDVSQAAGSEVTTVTTARSVVSNLL